MPQRPDAHQDAQKQPVKPLSKLGVRFRIDPLGRPEKGQVDVVGQGGTFDIFSRREIMSNPQTGEFLKALGEKGLITQIEVPVPGVRGVLGRAAANLFGEPHPKTTKIIPSPEITAAAKQAREQGTYPQFRKQMEKLGLQVG